MANTTGWQPTASLQTLQTRARLLQQVRAFFSARQVLEVETPNLSRAGSSDPHIESLRVSDVFAGQGYLHTSPEFAMKRLLAAGYGDIYQLCKVYRQGESSSRHNPEFSLLEWYRLGFDAPQLMTEVDEFLRTLLAEQLPLQESQRFTYQQVFVDYLQLDPLVATTAEIYQRASNADLGDVVGMQPDERDAWLDLLMCQFIEPTLAKDYPDRPVFIYQYPASQASLARLNPQDTRVAERFEVYINGMELANGFHELGEAAEQRQRFEQDNQQRKCNAQPEVSLDEHFLAALEQGQFPGCSGVALGFDRLVMLASGAKHIDQVISFAFENA